MAENDSALAEFQRLSNLHEIALLNLLGTVQHAIGNLNLNDPSAALRTLMTGYDRYLGADSAITEFHQNNAPSHAAKEAA